MKKKFFLVFILLISFSIFITGLNMYSSVAVEKIADCGIKFRNKCSLPGSCSYNHAYAASECNLTCVSKHKVNGVDRETTLKVVCGKWVSDDQLPEEPPDDGNPFDSWWQD